MAGLPRLNGEPVSRLSRIRDNRDYPEELVIPSIRRFERPLGLIGDHSSG